MKNGKPYKVRVQRTADRLKKGGFVKAERGCLELTDKGKGEAKRVKYNADAAGATYGRCYAVTICYGTGKKAP
jgi:hypothetical protein